MLIVAVTGLALVSCASPPQRQARAHRIYRHEPPPPPPAPAPPPPSPQVYFYPTQGQSADRQSQDKYECHLWAVKQSQFDPSRTPVNARNHVEYVPMPPPGHDTVAGAVGGAAVGAVVARDAGKGAVVGAIAGGVLGAASDSAREAEANRINDRLSQREADRDARMQEKVEGYRRAMGACLQGRGYSVQ